MDTKHTPGPWICHSGMVWKDGPNVFPKGSENGIPIARMDREPGNGTMPVERDSNAKLIAAAPELLEALREARKAMNHHGIIGDPAQFMADAAIDKAEGRA